MDGSVSESGLSVNGEAALRYLERGWAPIPLCYVDEHGRCACGYRHELSSAGKAPMVKWREREEITREDVVSWWSRTPSANVAILLHLSGLVVVDIDGPRGVEEIRKHGWDRTVTARTRKGYHLFFKRPIHCPQARRTKKGGSKEVDVLSLGYVVAAPSVHATGVAYRWLTPPEQELLLCPEWPVDVLEKARKEQEGRPTWFAPRQQRRKGRDGVMRTYSTPNNARDEWLEAALTYVDPEDYDVWLHVGMALKVWDLEGDGQGRGFTRWDQWSARSGDKYPGDKVMRAKWRSFGKRTGINMATIFGLAVQSGYTYDDPNQRQRVSYGAVWADY